MAEFTTTYQSSANSQSKYRNSEDENIQFDRVYRITVGVQGKDGVIISAGAKSNALNIKFDIIKDLTQRTNKCSLSIYNLSDDTRKLLEKEDTICTLEVGYSQSAGLKRIFVGYITQTRTRYSNGNVETQLELADGQIAIRDTVVHLSYSEGVSREKPLRDIASAMGLDLKISKDVTFSTIANGLVLHGKGATCLDTVCNGTNAKWSIQNNVLQIIKTEGTFQQEAIVLNVNSGLVGYPERILKADRKNIKNQSTNSKKHKARTKEKKAGWKLACLLQPTLNPADLIRIQSKVIDGWYKIESLKHVGEYAGQQWYTELEVYEIKPEDKKE